VLQIINTENDAPEALLSILRKIPSARPGQRNGAGASKGAHGYDIVG
jgi:hypothetical protein